MPFDPNKPYTVFNSQKSSGFDPNKPYNSVSTSESRQSNKETAYTGVFPEELITPEESRQAALITALGAVNPLVSDAIRQLSSDNVRRAEKSQVGSFAQGALRTLSAGMSDLAAKKALSVDPNSNVSDRNLSPYSFTGGEVVGAALPTGRVLSPAKTIKSLAGRSAASGAIYGFGSGASERALDDKAMGGDIISAGIERAVPAAVLSGMIPIGGAVAGKTATAIAKRLTESGRLKIAAEKAGTFLQNALRPRGKSKIQFQENAREFLPFMDKFAEANGKDAAKMTSDELLTLTDDAMEELAKRRESIVKTAEGGGFKIDGNSIAKKVAPSSKNAWLQLQATSGNQSLAGSAQRELEVASATANLFNGKQLSPIQAHEILKVLNGKQAKVWVQNGGKVSLSELAKSDPVLASEMKVAEALRSALDDIDNQMGRLHGVGFREYGRLMRSTRNMHGLLEQRIADENGLLDPVFRENPGIITAIKALGWKNPVGAAAVGLKAMFGRNQTLTQKLQQAFELGRKSGIKSSVPNISPDVESAMNRLRLEQKMKKLDETPYNPIPFGD